ncbi:hypothetical protein ANN_07028 [Periplaneta americana]|uniref:Uncharacterized protein n=1 Tax=Periplaneta americana TaxID=6978 RepID=A0ABQ8TFW6_PERAM|nr:hypothetical protein ANN_07028 [Periplaneta americana]
MTITFSIHFRIIKSMMILPAIITGFEIRNRICGTTIIESLMPAGNEFQSLGRAIVKEDEYEEVRWDGIVSIVSWRERVFRLWWEERSLYRWPPRTTGSLDRLPCNVAKRRWMASVKSTRGGPTRRKSFASDPQGALLGKLPKKE